MQKNACFPPHILSVLSKISWKVSSALSSLTTHLSVLCNYEHCVYYTDACLCFGFLCHQSGQQQNIRGVSLYISTNLLNKYKGRNTLCYMERRGGGRGEEREKEREREREREGGSIAVQPYKHSFQESYTLLFDHPARQEQYLNRLTTVVIPQRKKGETLC